MANRRDEFHLISIKGTLHAVGGSRRPGVPTADVEEFVEETGTWKLSESLPGKRWACGGVAVTMDLVCGAES